MTAQNLLPPEGSEASGSDAGQQPRQVAPPLEQLVTAFVQAVMQTQVCRAAVVCAVCHPARHLRFSC